MISAIKKNTKDRPTNFLFSFLKPTIPNGIPINASIIFGSNQCMDAYPPDLIWNINIQNPNINNPTEHKVSTRSVFFLKFKYASCFPVKNKKDFTE